jgi:hypothetical protein
MAAGQVHEKSILVSPEAGEEVEMLTEYAFEERLAVVLQTAWCRPLSVRLVACRR